MFYAPALPDSPLHGLQIDCVRALFEAEIDAWTRVEASEYLTRHTPTFYGAAQVRGLDQTRFLVDCAYVLAFVQGSVTKPLDWELPHLANARDEFERVGVRQWLDASGFEAEDSERFRVIDFAIRDVLGEDERCFGEVLGFDRVP